MSQPRLIRLLQQNWALERDGVEMYGALAGREKIPERREIFHRLSELERRHAEQWAALLRARGGTVPASHSGKAHATRVADTPGGLQKILLAIDAEERRDVDAYLHQMREVEDEAISAALREV